MQGRSWMAALTLTLALSAGDLAGLSHPLRAAEGDGDAKAPTTAPPVIGAAHTVKLELRIAGLSVNGPGCEVVIQPGHPGCKFKAVQRHVDSRGYDTVVIKDAIARNADRDCTFAITIREPGQPERTVRRGLRLSIEDGAAGQSLTCYLSSPSRIARNNNASATRKR